MTATFQQPSYPSDSGSAYPTNIDGSIMVIGQIAAMFAAHAVPATPAAPALSQTASGAQGARNYFVKVTLVTLFGESKPSAESSLAIGANNVLVVAAPGSSGALPGVLGYNVYVSTLTGIETKQNANPIALGAAWQEPNTGLIAGTALPAGMSLMSVLVDPGSSFSAAAVLTSKVQQNIGPFVAPSVNPRIDRIVLDAITFTASIVAGVEAGVPVPPAIPSGKLPCAQVRLIVGQVQIGNASITDERTFVSATPVAAGSDALSNLIYE